MPTVREFRLLAEKEDWDLDAMKMILYIWLITGHMDDIYVSEKMLSQGVEIVRKQDRKLKGVEE